MQKAFGRMGFECDIDCRVEHSVEKNIVGAEIHTFMIDWNYNEVEDDTFLQISVIENAIRHLYYWNPDCGFRRSTPCGWSAGARSMTSISAPVSCIYDGNGVNTFTCAVSEVKEIVELKTAIVNDSYFGVNVKIRLGQYIKCGHLTLKLFIDESEIPMYKALDNVCRWWEDECGLKSMHVPEDAKDAMYSYWYSFQQGLYQKEVLEEAKRVAELGLKTVIFDDGWQMEGVKRFFYGLEYRMLEKSRSCGKNIRIKLYSTVTGQGHPF